MSISTIKTAIKTKLDNVSSVGKTLDYVYWTNDWSDIYSKFSEDGRIDVWQIGWATSPPAVIDAGNRIRTYVINLFGLYSIKTSDESSKTFENIVEDVLNEFSESLSILSGTSITSTPALVVMENGVYVRTPVHRAQVQFSIEEVIAQDLACSG